MDEKPVYCYPSDYLILKLEKEAEKYGIKRGKLIAKIIEKYFADLEKEKK